MEVATYPYDSAELLDSQEAIAAYAAGMMAEDDPDLVRRAVGVVARAHGLLRLAADTGLSRDAIVDALSGEDPNGLGTMRAALIATGRSSGREAA